MANDINLPNLVSHLQVNLDGTSGAIADASRQGSAMGSALGNGVHRELDDLLRHLPQVQLDGDSDPLDQDLARVHRQLAELDAMRIGVDISLPDALRRLEDYQTQLQRIGDEHPTVNVRASTRQAAAQLDELLAAARHVDDTDVNIDVDRSTEGVGRLTGLLQGVGPAASAGLGAAGGLMAALSASSLAVAAALVALPLAFAGIGAAALKENKEVKAAFADTSKTIKDTLAESAKPLIPFFKDVASQVSGIVRELGPSLKQAFAATGPLLKPLVAGLGDLAKNAMPGIITAIQAAGPIFEALSRGLGDIGTGLSGFFEGLSTGADGAAQGLGALLSAVGGILPDLGSLLGLMAQIGGPVLAALTPALTTLVGALADGLKPIMAALGPVLEAAAAAIGQLVLAAAPLLPVIGDLVAALLPALTPLLEAVGQIFAEAAPVVQELATVLQDALAPILADLPTIVQPFADLFAQLARDLLPLLLELFIQLAPSLLTLGESLAQLLVASAPLIEAFASLVTLLLEGLTPILTPLIGLIGSLAAVLSDRLAGFITTVVVPALQIVSDLLRGDFSGAADVARKAALNIVTQTVAAFAGMPGQISGALSSLASTLQTRMAEATARLLTAAQAGIGQGVAAIAGLPGRAREALGSLDGVLFGAGASLIAGFVSGIISRISDVKSTLAGITNNLTSWKGPPARDAKILTPAGRLLIEGFIKGIDGTTAKLRSRLESITKALPTNVRSGIGKTLAKATRELEGLVTNRDKVIKRLAAGQKKLDDLVKQRSKAASDITSGILADANITTGNAQVNSVSAITVGLQQALKKTKEFQANIAKLKKAGLRGDLLQQVADAGVDAGSATAAALAKASPAELKKINDLQGQLAKSAAATGNTVADALYGAGVRAAQGLVDGLRSQEAAIEKTMGRIAEGMLKTVKKKHKTHSPSQEFFDIGVMDGEGLRGGLLSMGAKVQAAARSMAGAALDVASRAGSALTLTPSGPQLAATYAGTGGGDQHNTFNLYGSEASPDGILRALSWRGLVGRR